MIIENVIYKLYEHRHRFLKQLLCKETYSMNRVSIKDVANKAKVSVSTVSRIINNKSYPVSDELRKRVEKAIKELDYVPNKFAQNLRTNKTNVIGIIVRDISDPYFAEIAKGVTEKALELGYMALVCNSKRNIKHELKYHDLLLQQRVVGIIIAGGGHKSEKIKEALKIKIDNARKQKVKVVGLANQGVDLPLISVDNIKIGHLMGNYMINNNHHKIAFIGGNKDIITNEERLQGFIKSITTRNLSVNKDLIIHGDFTWKSGYESSKKLFRNEIDITGICCANDNIAIGVLRYLKEKNIKVPEEISVISVGDISLAKYTSPQLTTVKIPFYELGSKSVEFIASEEIHEDTKAYFDTHIVKRKSVKKILK